MTPGIDSYDALPYGSVPVAETHPERLAAIAALMGMTPPETARPRVLELGCAEGGNLIPMAFGLPAGEFVGVDLSRQQVEAGRTLIDELELANIHLEQRDVAAGLDDLGEFDFIIAHGLYSWVPHAVRKAIVDICARQLRPGGIAYVSFNVLPGWRMRGVLRDFLRSRVDATAGPAAQAAQARALLAAALPAWQARSSAEARVLAEEAQHLLDVSASYLFHEYLTDINEPCLFADFAAAAAEAGLRYVGDTDITAMLPDAAAAAALEALGCRGRIEREQQLDYLAVRKFRRALLTRSDAAVADWPQAAALHKLAFQAELGSEEELDLGSETAQRFDLADGGRVDIAHPLAKAAAMVLSGASPSRVAYADLLAAARGLVAEYGSAQWVEDDAGFERAWIELLAQQAVQPALTARHFPDQPAEKPKAHALARAQARAGGVVATARHGALRLDAAGAALLALCDGSRDLAALAAALREATTAAGKSWSAESAKAAVEHLLQVFLRAGLIVD